MTKSLLISIQPQWLQKILNGDKTYEVRKVVPKWVLEALERGETVEAYLYCTKGKPYLYYGDLTQQYEIDDYKNKWGDELNGTIPVKVVIDGYEIIDNEPSYKDCYERYAKQSCMTFEEWYQYFTWSKTGGGYALHISKVEIFDEVMKLGEFYKTIHYPKTSEYMTPHICEYKNVIKAYCGNQDDCLKSFELKRPPQNMMTVWVK
jgi:predicted transcriptional regulator